MRRVAKSLFFVTIVCLIPVLHVDASEDVDGECYFTVNDDCDHYNSAKVVSEFEGHVAALSGDGDYLASIDHVTEKYTIYSTRDMRVWEEGYLVPGYTFGMDHITYNLVTYNETRCTFVTEPKSLCEIDAIHTESESVSHPSTPSKTYLTEESEICEFSDSGWFDEGWCGDGIEDGFLSYNDHSEQTISPDGNYMITYDKWLVDTDVFDEDDYDAILVASKVHHWELYRAGEWHNGSVASAVSEKSFIHVESEESPDILGWKWSPDAKVAYILTSDDIYTFSTEDHTFSSIEWLSDSQSCYSDGESGDSVDFGGANLILSADGSTLVYTCGDNSWVVLLSHTNWTWWNILTVVSGIAIVGALCAYAYRRYKQYTSSKLNKSVWLAIFIVFAGCIESTGAIPSNPSVTFESAPSTSDLVGTLDTNQFVPIEAIDVWVDLGNQSGFWCEISYQAGEDGDYTWYQPGKRYFTVMKSNPDLTSYCEDDRCNWSADIYYLGEIISKTMVIQFGN